MTTITCRNNFNQMVTLPREKFVFRPSVYGLIVADNKVVCLRNKGDRKLWLPGGGLEIGERIEDGLHREIGEETGLRVSVEQFLFFRENFFYYQPLDEAYHAFLFFYLCRTQSANLIPDKDVNDLESGQPRWIPFSQIHSKDFSDFGKDIHNVLINLETEKN